MCADLQAVAPADGATVHPRGPARRLPPHSGAASVAGTTGQDRETSHTEVTRTDVDLNPPLKIT